jgi:hypothetical protein
LAIEELMKIETFLENGASANSTEI